MLPKKPEPIAPFAAPVQGAQRPQIPYQGAEEEELPTQAPAPAAPADSTSQLIEYLRGKYPDRLQQAQTMREGINPQISGEARTQQGLNTMLQGFSNAAAKMGGVAGVQDTPKSSFDASGYNQVLQNQIGDQEQLAKTADEQEKDALGMMGDVESYDREQAATKSAQQAERDLNDPSSGRSRQAQEALSQYLSPATRQKFDVSKLSAAQIEKQMPLLMKQQELDRKLEQDQIIADQNLAFQREKLKSDNVQNSLNRQASAAKNSGDAAPKVVDSAGQKELDKKFAGEYNDWLGQSGKPVFEKNIKRLDQALNILAKDPSLTGKDKGFLPDFFRSPEYIELRSLVQSAAQGALKATLGAQFTQAEGERIMKLAFDPYLPAAENIRKIKSAIEELKSGADLVNQKAKYFENNGQSLAGFREGGGMTASNGGQVSDNARKSANIFNPETASPVAPPSTRKAATIFNPKAVVENSNIRKAPNIFNPNAVASK